MEQNSRDSEPVESAVGESVVTSPKRFSFLQDPRKRKIFLIIALLILIPLVIFLITKNQIQPTTTTQTTTPSPTPKSVYLEKAEQTMTPSLKQLLTTAYVPTSLTVAPVTRKDGSVTDEKLLVGTEEYANGSILISRTRYRNKNGALDYKYLDMFLPQSLATLTQTGAEQTAGQYFTTKPQGTWKCASVKTAAGQTTQCENFWTDKLGVKKGIGITQQVHYKTEKRSVLYYCELYRNGTRYKNTTCSSYEK